MTQGSLIATLACAATAVCADTRLTQEGLRVQSGRATYTLGYPQFMESGGSKTFKPIETKADGTHAALRYQDGASLEVTLDAAGGIVLTPRALPPAWRRFKMESQLGFALAEGGTFAVGEGGATPFPASKPTNPMLYQGAASDLTLTTGEGDAVAFRFPQHAYLQLQDNRAWGWKMFQFYIQCPYDANWGAFTVSAGTMRKDAAAQTPVRVDSLGQNAKAEWPQKASGVDELKADAAAEDAYYASFDLPPLDAYGGLPGSREALGLSRTGFFHVEKKTERWHLVDPEGNLFFHLGVCCFQPYQSDTKVAGREEVYAWLPPRDGEFATAWGDKHGRTREEFNFHLANMIRKYGKPYDPTDYAERLIRRVRAFGFNSGGAFGAPDKAARERLTFPYTSSLPLSKWGDGMKELDREVWDPFDKENRERVERNFQRLAKNAADPLLIGYFIANEPLYENLPSRIPTLDASWACKRALVDLLRTKYRTVEALRAAWDIRDGATFDELYARGLPVKTPQAAEDMQAYMAVFYETLYALVSDQVRRNDPNHMILGSRLQYGTLNNELYCRIMGKHTDIVSFNYYTYGLDRKFLDKVQAWTGGKPMIFSEFYWDSPSDSGLPGGVKDVNSQEERGLAYRHYVENAAALGYVVGVQWYSLLDTHYTGVGFAGYGGWNANEGLFSVVDRPWKAMIAQMAKTNRDIYPVLLGKRAPFVWDDPRFSAAAGGTKTVKASRAPGPLAVDGRSEDWPGVPAEAVGGDRLVEGATSGGVEAAFKVCWDENRLYVLADVVDPTPMRNDQTGENVWNADAVELFVGHEAPDQGGALRFSDRHLLLAASARSDASGIFVRNAPDGDAAAACRVAVVPKADGKGYVLEAAVPWSVLAVKPAMERELLFDLGIDDGETPKRRDRQLMWNGTIRNATGRDAWGRLRLVQ